MIYSMTAFARNELKAEWGTAVWEIRSVNQRYLETYFRLPEQFRGLEPLIRERLRKKLQRGKVECSLKFNTDPGAVGELKINKVLAEQLIQSAQWISDKAHGSQLNPVDILRWPGVIEAEEQDADQIQKQLLESFNQTLTDFIDARAQEGENLKQMIVQRLEGVVTQTTFVQERMPEVIAWQKERVLSKFEEIQGELDENRIEQEMILYAQKLDVAEEMDRLLSHVKETQKIMDKGGAVGRRLDFMMQEFNRESNTLASKSINSEVTNAAVELKVLIEQMREQIQNIE